MWDEARGDLRTVLDAWAFIKDTRRGIPATAATKSSM